MAAQSALEIDEPVSAPKISLCMIVKDEAAVLPRCLQSVQDVADEMIVVDTGSTDRTVEMAQQFGATVYHHPWTDNFAEARNESLRHAQGDWILVLDADEALMPDCLPAIRRAIQSPSCLAVTLLREEIGAQQNPYSLLCRLFRRHPQIRFQRPYHETVDDSVATLLAQEPSWELYSLPMAAIAHDGYRPEAIAQQGKSDRAERIMGRYLQAHPQDAYICSKLGALYVAQGRNAEGWTLLTQGLATEPQQPAVLYELHYHLGLAHTAMYQVALSNSPMRHLGFASTASAQIALAQQHYEEALATELLDVLKLAAYINLAALYSDRNAWTQAEALLTHVLAIQPEWAIAHYNLGLVYKAQGNFGSAITAYQQAIALQPYSPEAYQNLGVVYLKQGQVLESLAAFQEAIALHILQDNPDEAIRLQQTLADMGWQV
jgi:tetratricopeptide (TPR) repeat protein